MPDSPRFAYRVREGLLEIPVTTLRLGSTQPAQQRRRLLPAAALCAVALDAERSTRSKTAKPAVFYFHPWEIDPGQPRVPGIDAKTRFRHYVNIPRTHGRLQRLLGDFRWGRMDRDLPRPEASPRAVALD